MEYSFFDGAEANSTKNRIMLEAAILFARHGYAAVSMRDIAKQANIQSASIYNHFSGKEELFDIIVDNIKDIYLNFYVRLEKEIVKATSFEQVLDCLFAELMEVYHIFIYYGVSLVITEQFRNEKARNVFNDVLMRVGIDYSRRKFDECVRRKWVKEFDTEALATLFTNSVLIGTLMRTHEDMNQNTAYDPQKMFIALRQYMLDSVELMEVDF